jgi:RimJ/RimL family protein N-acetyltransferase
LLIAADCLGKGYARDAVAALLDHFFARWGGRRVELQVRADNQRAIRFYERLGFQVEGRRREVIPPDWGPPESRDYLWMGLLEREFLRPR